MENEYQRATAQMADSQGNTVLHALVMVADYSKDKDKDNTEFITNIYDRILKTTAQLHPKLKLEDIENHKGLTPLKMAAKTGKIGVNAPLQSLQTQQGHTYTSSSDIPMTIVLAGAVLSSHILYYLD